jgi:hypothetical protein
MIKVWTDAAEAGILERIEAAIADASKELRGKDDQMICHKDRRSFSTSHRSKA